MKYALFDIVQVMEPSVSSTFLRLAAAAVLLSPELSL